MVICLKKVVLITVLGEFAMEDDNSQGRVYGKHEGIAFFLMICEKFMAEGMKIYQGIQYM